MAKIDVDQILKNIATATGIAAADLQGFFAQGEQKTYKPEEWLFHESTPRPAPRITQFILIIYVLIRNNYKFYKSSI